MNICSNCGVELDENITECPLCRNRPVDSPREKPVNETYPSDIIRLYKDEFRRHLLELTGIIALSGIFVCTIVDLVIDKGLMWSLYADISILSTWIILSILLTDFRKYFVALPVLLLNILLMLFLFDLFSPPVKWFLPIGLPVASFFFISVAVIVFLVKVLSFRGFSILGFSFLLLILFCITTEVFFDKYLFDQVDIRWSAIAGGAIFPISLILFFMHFRMKRGRQLDSFFHV